MASIVMKAIGGNVIGDAAHQAVDVAQAASQIMDVVRDQTNKANEAAREENNEFNIRKNFLDNTVEAIKEATLGQFNIVICTDQAEDDFQELTGRILPMDLVDVQVGDGKSVNFQVYVFDTGKYLRHGRWERDSWWYYGETEKFNDPFAMHVHFEKAQPKLNPDEVQQLQTAQGEEAETADAVNSAAQGAEDNGEQQLETQNEEPEPEHNEEPEQKEEAQPQQEEEPEQQEEAQPQQEEEPEPEHDEE